MKRPLLPLTVGIIIATWCTLQYDPLSAILSYRIPIAFFILILGALIFKFKRLAVLAVLIIGALIGLLFTSAYTHFRVRPVQALEGQSHIVTATVMDVPQQYEDNQRVSVRFSIPRTKKAVFDIPAKSLVYLPHTNHKLSPGDKISTRIEFYAPDVLDGFDRRRYYTAEGYFILGKCVATTTSELTILSAKQPPLWSYPLKVSQAIKAKMDLLLPTQESAFMKAILLGDKSGLSSSNLIAMKKAGLLHVMAVSGMHIGFLVGFFFLIFGRKHGMILSIVAILFFIPMTGATPSVLRAGIMYFIAAVGFFLGKERNGISALCAALLILLLCNPYAIESIGLQLSFAATLGLIVISPPLKDLCMRLFQNAPRLAKRWIGIMLDGIICSISALCFTAPILFLAFGYVSILAPLANFMTLGAIAAIFTIGIVACFTTALIPITSNVFATCLTFLIHYVLIIANKVASLPYGLVYADQQYSIIAILALCSMIFIVSLTASRVKVRFILPPVLIVLVFLGVANTRDQRNTMLLSILPSGSGQAIAIAAGEDAIVIDCSGSGHREAAKNVEDWLLWWGYDHISTLVLTSVDKTHARDVPYLLNNMDIGRMIIPDQARKSDIATKVMSTATACYIPVQVWGREEGIISDSTNYEIRINGAVERKLLVQIQAGESNILIAHSLTQKMLQEALSVQELHADTVILSENNISDLDMLDEALQEIGANKVILQSGYSTATKIAGLPARNTMLEGEITLRVPLADEGGK